MKVFSEYLARLSDNFGRCFALEGSGSCFFPYLGG